MRCPLCHKDYGFVQPTQQGFTQVLCGSCGTRFKARLVVETKVSEQRVRFFFRMILRITTRAYNRLKVWQ